MASLNALFFILAAFITSEVTNGEEHNKMSVCPASECYGWCCPFVNAVCCSDGNQCCPSNTVCLTSLGLCMGFNAANSTIFSQQSAPMKPKGLCPFGMTQCGSGCCPLRSAVCCSDEKHCCPSGYTCNYAVWGCVRGRLHAPFLEKFFL